MQCSNTFLCALFFFLGSFTTNRPLQTEGTFTDTRDGKTYHTFTLGTTEWMAENMKFKTLEAEVHSKNKHGIDPDGYYYPFKEIEQVCPCDFRIPTSLDWEAYFSYLLDLKNIPDAAKDFFGYDKKGEHFVACEISDNQLKPFQEPNPLRLRDHGHTQGGKLVGIGSMNFWIKHHDYEDPKYHLHLTNTGFFIHSHNHHITKKKRKLRKFAVRCVRDLEQN